jgi:hypothetical protein
MTGLPIKKKRFEGLIQFQDPLRQAMVCLQASLAERFTTGAHIDFLKTRDSVEASHFLLTSDGSIIGEMEKGLEERHLLMRVEQLDQNLPRWQSPELDNKITAWLDSSDALTSQYFYQILAQASGGTSPFDLRHVSAWGASQDSWTDTKTLKIEPWMNRERIELLNSFRTDASSLFSKLEVQSVSTDGCSVALLLEGECGLQWKDCASEAIKNLAKANRHLLAINYISGPKPRLQIAYITPMRLPLKDLQASTLKGFLLMRDIKVKVILPHSVIAS